jgi:ribosomal protein RSM22 (predicted rRNA methylase)
LSREPGAAGAGAAFLAALEGELGELARRDLRGPASALSERYRSAEADEDPHRFSSVDMQAYLATRAPATFAASRRVLAELASLRPGWAPESLLDLGAGPGTATWAAVDVFASIGRAVLVERDREAAALGARLGEGGLSALVPEVSWTVGDATSAALAESDLVVAAYVLGEIGQDRVLLSLKRWWGATRGELVILEPGTPAGFERLRAARSALISWGAKVTAPCPHDGPCPMEGSDWCHFAVRLERSGLHRDLKAARLGHEDEKYSYLSVSSSGPFAPAPRLVRSPRPHKGHVRLVLCEPGGLFERVISRRQGELYRRARDLRWGDRFQLD